MALTGAGRLLGARPRRRGASRNLVGVVAAVAVVGPLLALPLSFVRSSTFGGVAGSILPSALGTSLLIGAGVGVGTLVVGGGLALLVSFWDFPGRRWLEWALVLPMAMPSYVLVFVVLGTYGLASPLHSNLFGDGLRLPGLHTPAAAIAVLTGVLYPYVYVLGRTAFLGQARQAIEAARSLGRSYGQAVRRVALPLARPALAAGVALAVMEALADFGTVDLLGLQALPSAIFRVWNGTHDEVAALQLASVLVGLALLMLAVERIMRGRARYDQAAGAGEAAGLRPLQGIKRWLAPLAPTLLLLVVFGVPSVQLGAWAWETVSEGRVSSGIGRAIGNTAFLAAAAAAITVAVATLMVLSTRARKSRVGAAVNGVAVLGYAIPGTVVAVVVFVPFVTLDRALAGWARDYLGWDVGLVLTRTVLGLLYAYVIRFLALAYFAVEARSAGVGTDIDAAARVLGADRTRLLADVHLPLLWPGILTAGLLVLVEVMKELPATALLRPIRGDTLAVTVWDATKDTRFDAAALPALLIVVVGLLPVVLLVRRLRSDGWGAVADGGLPVQSSDVRLP